MDTSLGSNASFAFDDIVDDVIEDVNSDDLEPMLPNARLTFNVWPHFERKRSKSISIIAAICKYCRKNLKGLATFETSHLRKHFTRCKTNEEDEGHLNKRVRMDDNWVFDQEVVRKALGFMIALHDYPLCMVEHVDFREFMKKAQHLFKSRSRNTIKSDILQLYDIDHAKTMSLLRNSKGRVAITTDMWTTSNQTKVYMAVTTHFMNDEWKL